MEPRIICFCFHSGFCLHKEKKKNLAQTLYSLSEAFLEQMSPIGLLLGWGFLAMTADSLFAFQVSSLMQSTHPGTKQEQ